MWVKNTKNKKIQTYLKCREVRKKKKKKINGEKMIAINKIYFHYFRKK